MLKKVSKVLEKGSLLTFDCGGNSKENKKKIIELEFNYLTLRPKRKDMYKKYIEEYRKSTFIAKKSHFSSPISQLP